MLAIRSPSSGKDHDLVSMGLDFTNLTCLTLNMRRRTLVLSDVFLTMTQLRSIDIAFSLLADRFQGYGNAVEYEDEDCEKNAAQQRFADGGSCFRFLESITLRYFPCTGVDSTSDAVLGDGCEVLPMRANFGGEDAGDEYMCEDLDPPHAPTHPPCPDAPRAQI